MSPIEDHPLRYQLANELHARPFPVLRAPCRAVYLAIKQPRQAATRDRARDLDHLKALLDRYGAQHPQPGATHYSGRIGKHELKWEQHTEFVTYTVFIDGLGERPFDAGDLGVYPSDWLAEAPGACLTSALIRVVPRPDDDAIQQAVGECFVPESVAVSRVIDDDAVVVGDFHLDPAGHMRFAVFPSAHVGERRIGRIVQRLCEIETYKTMSMLGFTRVKEIGVRMGEIDDELSGLMEAMTHESGDEENTLRQLLTTSAELDNLRARIAFRLGATGAYEAIVGQRISVLREERYHGRQTFGEFMMRASSIRRGGTDRRPLRSSRTSMATRRSILAGASALDRMHRLI